jgi:hypothetical protein
MTGTKTTMKALVARAVGEDPVPQYQSEEVLVPTP